MLESRVKETTLVETHSDLAEGLVASVIAMVAVAATLTWWTWNERRGAEPRAPTWVTIALIAGAVVAAAGTTVQAIRIGHCGATAVWSQDLGTPPASDGDDD